MIPGSEFGQTPFLTLAEQQLLLQMARQRLVAHFAGQSLPLDNAVLTPRLREKHGVFVSLRQGGSLRGCIGHTRGIRPLAAAVREIVLSAATRDPRFPPVTREELAGLRIEIAALCPGPTPDSPFIPVREISEIVIGRDGLYLDHAGPKGGGLLLPRVALDQGWDAAAFLAGVCQKAGAPDDAWRQPQAQLYRFAVHAFSEPETGTQPASMA